MRLDKTKFIQCELEGVDFEETNLSMAVFEQCSLQDARFGGADLRHANVKTSYGISIHPEEVKLKGAIFSNSNIAGLLIHTQIIIKD